MNLKKTLKTIDKDTIIFIGAKSGWIFIGKKDEFFNYSSELNDRYYNSLKKRIPIIEKNINETLKTINSNFNKKATIKNKISKIYRLYSLASEYNVYSQYLNKWKKFEDRQVLRIYDDPIVSNIDDCYNDIGLKTDGSAKMIIIHGFEEGPYWSKDEFINSKKLKTGRVCIYSKGEKNENK